MTGKISRHPVTHDLLRQQLRIENVEGKKRMHVITDTQVRGPYDLLRQYQPDLRIFFKQWFGNEPLGYGFTRYCGKLDSRCHALRLDALAKLWREDRINSILDENDLVLDALENLDNRHTKIEQKAWQYYGQILHLMHRHSQLPEYESSLEATERSLREIKKSMRDVRVVNQLWLDVENIKQKDPSIFEDCNLQEHESLGIRCPYVTLPGTAEKQVRIEGDRVSIRLGFALGESALAGLAGKPLEAVIEHPLINGKGYIIWSAVQWGVGTVFSQTLALHVSMFESQHLSEIEFIEG